MSKPNASSGSSNPTSTSHSNAQSQSDKSYFEQQRSLIMQDISVNMEHVLQNINKLNRSLEGIITVGNEFSSVEALWSHFENIMAKDPGQLQTSSEGRSHGSQASEDQDRDVDRYADK